MPGLTAGYQKTRFAHGKARSLYPRAHVAKAGSAVALRVLPNQAKIHEDVPPCFELTRQPNKTSRQLPVPVGGHLIQHGLIDVCLVGSDRTTGHGDVCNKVGTYLKALAAKDNQVPFYAALPHSTIDWNLKDGVSEIPIEERSPREVSHLRGIDTHGQIQEICVVPSNSKILNLGFDITPARLVTGIITERGVCEASAEGLRALYGEDR